MAGKQAGMGLYIFEPVRLDPQQQAAADKRSKDFGDYIKGIATQRDLFGWDSQECRLARLEMARWQRDQRMEGQRDQNTNCSDPIIQQQIAR